MFSQYNGGWEPLTIREQERLLNDDGMSTIWFWVILFSLSYIVHLIFGTKEND